MSYIEKSVDRIAVELRKKLQRKLRGNDLEVDSSQATNFSPVDNHQQYYNNTNMQIDDYVDDTQETSSIASDYAVQKKRKRIYDDNSNILKRIKVTDTVIQETPTSSLASAAKTFYCSQNLYESVGIDNPDVSIVQSKPAISCSQTKISLCSTTPTATTDADKTLSGLDCSERKQNSLPQNEGYVMSQLYDSQNALQHTPPVAATINTENRILTQLYDSSSCQLQKLTSSLSVESFETATDDNDTESDAVEDDYSGRSMNKSVSMMNHPPTSADDLNTHSPADLDQSPASDSDPFALTPVDTADPLTLPPTLLLSNCCSEYDKAYTMRDLKPNQYRNYRHHESLRSLKEHLDSLIPPQKSLKDHYKMKNYPDN